MNLKQKLTYMLIGCLFTMAGFVLSSLFNTPTHVQAQDEKKAVFDKIVCKELVIVNDEGKTMATLGTDVIGGYLSIRNDKEKVVAELRAGWGVRDGGVLSIRNAAEKKLVVIGSEEGRPNDGLINIYNHRGEWRSYKGD